MGSCASCSSAHACSRVAGALVVEDDCGFLARHVLHQLVELHADQSPFAVARRSSVRFPRPCGSSSARWSQIRTSSSMTALELEGRQAGQPLIEPLLVRLERPDRLVHAGEDVRDLPELITEVADEDGHGLALRMEMTGASGLLGALGGAMAFRSPQTGWPGRASAGRSRRRSSEPGRSGRSPRPSSRARRGAGT